MKEVGQMIVVCATVLSLVLGMAYMIKSCQVEKLDRRIEMIKLEK